MSARTRSPSTGRALVKADAAGCGCRDPLLQIGLPALPVAAARPIVLTAAERHRLKKAAWGHKSEHRARVRAPIVLRAARGRSNARIAVEVGVHVDTVRTWRGRFAARRRVRQRESSLLRAGLVPAWLRLPSAARPAAGVSQLRPCPAQPGMTRFAADNGRTGKWGV
ncbi:helix-turn-helix domain-containing protein [Streptomyces sp. NPDC090075]|uniref:helix-turn-helix domain-containing protein n=1 Tax=unclassified Streptomyces TaxID=2593676 RepID=UPI0038260FA8